MPFYDPSKSEIEPPKEAKSHASFKMVQMVMELIEILDFAMINTRVTPSRANLGNAINILKQIWLKVFTIQEELIVERVFRAFNEFGAWFDRYTTNPGERIPFYPDKLIQEQCFKRIEDLYCSIMQGLQNKQFLFKIEERGRQNLATRMDMIERGLYGHKRKTPGKPEPARPEGWAESEITYPEIQDIVS